MEIGPVSWIMMTAELLILFNIRAAFIRHFSQFSLTKVLVAQSCLTVCDPVDCTPPGLLSLGFSTQEHWSELPFPIPGHRPNPRIEP